MQFIIKLPIICLLLLFSTNTFGQGTSCATATTLNIDGVCDSGNISDNTQDLPNIASCNGFANFKREGWYTFTVTTGPLDINITALSNNRNLFLQLISSTSSCTGLSQINCANNDTANNSAQTETINATLNNGIYYIKVANVSGGNNPMTLNSICVTSSAPLANDDCSTATTLNCGDTNISGSTIGSSNTTISTGCTISNYGVWYSFIGDGQQTTISSTSSGGWDHEMNIVSGSCGTLTNISCEDSDFTNGTESYTFTSSIGTNYYIYIAHWDSTSATTGNFTISRTCSTPPTTPTNDDCSAAVTLNCGDNIAGTTNNSTAASSGTGCSISDYGVWYTFTGDGIETTITTDAAASFDHEMAIASGSCGSLTNITCEDSTGNGGIESYTFTPILGVEYYIYIADYYTYGGATDTGNFTISRTCVSACTPPTAQPTNLTFGTITDNSIDGSFTASAPASSNYLVLMNTTGTTPTPPTNTTSYAIGNTTLGATVVDNDENTNFTATGLNPTTTYYFFIYSFNDFGCFGGPLYNTINPLTDNETTLIATYCIPSSTDTSNYIDDFITTGAINNINHTNSGFSTAGYGDFTSMVVEQLTGSNVDFTINFVGGTYETNIWVDWNNDTDFDDANEKVFETAGYSDPTIGSFTVLGTAAPGNYRMRIRSDWLNSDPDPCGYDDDSETHDYTLTVTPLNCTDNPVSLTGITTSTTTGTISWTDPAPAPANGYEYIVSTDNTTGTPGGDISGTTTGTTVNLTGLTAGTTYYVFVRGICNAVDFGVWITTTFTTGCSNIITTPTVCPLIAGEQGVDPFTADPFDPDPSFSLDCTSPSLTLQAHSTIRETDSYIVEQIAYPNPAPEYEFPTFGGAGVQTIDDDDVWADARTNLGFNFCFYGNTYTETLVGANGMITFDNSYIPGSYCGYSFNANLPSLAGALFNNTIYGVYHDLDPRGLLGTPIKSRVIGTPGCRQFIISWIDIPMFDDASRLYTGMIVLHETTNIIEVFIEEKRIANGDVYPWNDGNAIVGIQGDGNTGEAIAAPCRNGLDTNWETTNEAWRFVPNGAIIAPDSVTWYSASTGAAVIGTGSTLTVTTPDTYTAEVTYTSCGNTVTFSDDVIVDQSSKTWMGYIDNNWYIDGNWEPNGVPTSSDCVLIPDIAVSNVDFPVADIVNLIPLPPQPANALNLTVASSASLEVSSNTKLIVTDWIHLDGTINIRNNGSLIQINNGAPNVNNNTGNGNINMQRTATIASSYDYIYWSSPVEGFSVSNVSPGSSYIYEWIPTIPGNGAGNYGNWQATTENMVNGKGYIIRNVTGTPTPSTPEFVGRPNNGVITKAITRGNYNGADYAGGGNTIATNLDDNWNLIGNPYPSAISADTFISVNAAVIADDTSPAISGTVYLWRHLAIPSNAINDPFYEDFVYNYNPNDYIAYNSTGSNPSGFGGDIAAGQSFFVLMEDTAPVNSTVSFDNIMRNETLNNSQFYRNSQDNNRSSSIEKHRIWLDLITPNNTANSILVGYVDGASNSLDRLYDGHELSETSTRFYSIIEEEELGIQGKSLPFDENDTVALGIEIPQNGNYSIAINTLDGLFQNTNQAIYIEDTYTNLIHNLRINPYSFNIDSGTYNDRFILRYTDESLSVDNFEISGLEILAPNNKYIKVKSGNSNIETVIVYDLLGRTLINQTEINASEITFNNNNFSEGAYIVKAVLENGSQKIQKVVLKN
ncbi:GEVED domain-containing protein [Oceanihabitans sp. 2_MG-2023]|uniref:GEVED domain-containing protein n=1 Tax=Oceanihabitans sp. 2_MG-2023 TaxID=3062661 RepID=UPI0026E12C98|nr:GEVED domain-containing protein [Oceanihabitans sp. 2_MG-2023]MDO6596078.1 GEVED domain-containing protein [Oceanihabitans sp. 2_MG-2023]